MTRRLFLVGVAGAAGCGPARRPRLNVFNWSAYVAPDTIPNFESEFGVRVRYATYESNEEMLAKVLSGNSGWDVVFPTYNRIAPMRQYGLLAPLHEAWLRNLDNLDARFRAPAWDARLAWASPTCGTPPASLITARWFRRRPRGRTCGAKDSRAA